MSEPTEEQIADAKEKLAIVYAAADFEDLLKSRGWERLGQWQEKVLQKDLAALLNVDTANTEQAINALQRWQIGVKFVEEFGQYVQTTLDRADELRGRLTMDDALIMEKLKNEPEPAPRPDPAGY